MTPQGIEPEELAISLRWAIRQAQEQHETISRQRISPASRAGAMARVAVHIKALEAILDRLAPQGEPVAWQDMSNAPKDGRAILIERDTAFDSEERWHIVRWDEDDGWQVHDGKFDHTLRGPEPKRWLDPSTLYLAAPSPDLWEDKGYDFAAENVRLRVALVTAARAFERLGDTVFAAELGAALSQREG